MSWTPLGPTTVIERKNTVPTRMTRANETGAQTAVLDIAVHPNDNTNIVVVVRRVGGTTAFHTTDDGHSWNPIADTLTQLNPQLDISCAALHPSIPNVIYLGSRGERKIFASTDGGQTWPVQNTLGIWEVTRLIVDRASDPTDPTKATLYAATSQGIAWSTNGGSAWSYAGVLGEITSLAVYMPLSGARRFYAGVYGAGLFYYEGTFGPGLFPAANPSWQNLFGTAGLPGAASFGPDFVVLADYCARQPDRVYAMIAPLSASHMFPQAAQLFVSTAAPPTGTWEQRGAGAQPPLDEELEGIAFLVAPESNGADTQDVLLCSAGILPSRSTDGGRTWQAADYGQILHTDTRSLAHHPPKPAYYTDSLPLSATAPRARIYVGCDGGLGASLGYSDPSFGFDVSPSDLTFNADATYTTSENLIESLNHGLASIAAHQYASNPDPLSGGPMSLVGYATTLDTGCARRVGAPAWANVSGGDAGLVYAAPTNDGVALWMNASFNIIWPAWNLQSWVDQDPATGIPTYSHVTTAASPSCAATSNMVSAPAGGFYSGIIAFEEVTTLASAVTGGGQVVVTPVAMTPDLIVGARVCLGDPSIQYGWQPISSVTATTFTVLIYPAGPFPAGTAVRVIRCWIGNVNGSLASQISQPFIPQSRRPYRLARSGDALLAAGADQRLWTVASASTAGPTTVWTEVSGAPAGLGAALDPNDFEGGEFESGLVIQNGPPVIGGLAADSTGTFYVMLSVPVGTPPTPLFSVQGGTWVPETCTLPLTAPIPTGVAVGKLIADPVVAQRLYVARNARVFQLDKGSSGWLWSDLTGDLPGQEIHDLWLGNVAPIGLPVRMMLRATTAVRGVWERELNGPPISNPQLYFRDHAFDVGWLGSSADGVDSPLSSNRKGWHWQSPDILVDTPLRDSTGALYYQNDPEAPTPTAADFAWFEDRSESASAGVTARVWVRVHNRNPAPSSAVDVWVITAPFSGGLPLLPTGFWSNFHADGTIDSTLPAASAWASLGVQSVSEVRAEAPGIAGFQMPTGSAGDHRCIVAFIHGPGALLDTTGLDLVVDHVVPSKPQIAQRNVFVTAPLPASPGTPAPPGSSEPIAAIVESGISIDFHNPLHEVADMSVHFDLRALPASAHLDFSLSRNAKPQSVIGAKPLSGRRSTLRATPSPGRLPLQDAVHTATGGGIVQVRGLALEPQEKVASQFVLRFDGKREPGDVYQMDVLQMVRGKVLGGATIIVPVAGAKSVKNGLNVNWDVERESAAMAERRPTKPGRGRPVEEV